MNQGGARIYEGLNRDVANTALGVGTNQMNMIMQLLGGFMPGMLGYGTAYAPIGQFGESGSSSMNANVSVGPSAMG